MKMSGIENYRYRSKIGFCDSRFGYIFKSTREVTKMSQRFTAVIVKEKKWYVAHCIELGVASQGKTIEKAQANLREAVELYVGSFGQSEM
jgi:predicted RNase H-like HicB family nuclease